jgi:hypothetical protein
MFKTFVLILLFSLSLLAQALNYGYGTKHAFLLQKDVIQVKSSFNFMNDSLDIFSFNDGAIRDLQSYNFEFRYGLNSKNSLFMQYDTSKNTIYEKDLKIQKIDLFDRYNIVNNDYAVFHALSLDFGVKLLSADYLNARESLSLDTQSQDFYTRALVTKKLSYGSLADFYIGYEVAYVEGSLNSQAIDAHYDTMTFGAIYTIEKNDFIYELSYEHQIFLNSGGIEPIDNDIFDISLSYAVSPDFLVVVASHSSLKQSIYPFPSLNDEEKEKSSHYMSVGFVYSL